MGRPGQVSYDGGQRPARSPRRHQSRRHERAFRRARLHAADIVVYPDNLTIFDRLAEGDADVMITDASGTRFQEKLHPNVLSRQAVRREGLLDAPRPALKAFVDQWLHFAMEDGEFDGRYAKWFR